MPRPVRPLGSVPLLVALACCLPGCLKKDYPTEGPVVSRVELTNAEVVDPDEILDRLSTAASPRFLGIWDGVVFEYEVYDEALLSRDLERIQRYYRARGYYEATVTAARVVETDAHHVRVEIRVYEGSPVLTREIRPSGLERIDLADSTAALEAIRLEPGEPFDEQVFEESKKAILNALGDRGYAFAKIRGQATVDIARHTAVVTFEVEPGPKAVYGPIRIAGLDRIPERPVRENLDIEEGKPYSRAEVEDARTQIVNLGVFSSVDIRQDRSRPDTREVPITVVVEESALRTVKLGGGMRFDVLEWSAHLDIGWEHRNFLGGMRRFRIETKPGMVLFPTRMDNFVAPTNVFFKNKARMELRQPSFIEGRTTGFLAGEFNIFPVLYPDSGPGDNVIGFRKVAAQGGVERPFFGHHLYVTPSYNWEANFPFTYLGTVPEGFGRVTVSYPELRAILDFRDDPIQPHAGVFVSNDVQVAGFFFGGDATDVKVRPELRTYVPISKTVTFATRATMGFVFPQNYGSTLKNTTNATTADIVRDQQLLLFRAFYSGGPTSNRGYPYRGVGPHGVLGFLVPSGVRCDFNDPNPPNRCLRPLGGLTLWEATAEVRFPIVGPLRAALFVDASDVTRSIADLRFDHPHLSPGFGLRYQTPVGPIRLDVGYRVPYAQVIGRKSLPDNEGHPNTVFGLPIAVHFGLGEAF